MAEEIICEECYDSPSYKPTFNKGGTPSGTTHLRVKNTADRDVAYRSAIAWLNANRRTFYGLCIQSIEIKPIEGTDCWDVNVEYGYRKADLNVVLDYKFQTTGGSSHITRTFENVVSKSCVNGLPAYDFGGAIGVNSEGEVEGVDIKSPAFSWSQTQAFPVEMVTWEFRKMLASYTAKVNNAPFMGFDAGEVLFEGVTDGQLAHDTNEETGNIFWYYKLTFSFSAMPNIYGIQIGDAIVDKWGWEYLWILWETIVSGNTTTKYPRNVCVEQVYETADLNDLGLLEV